MEIVTIQDSMRTLGLPLNFRISNDVPEATLAMMNVLSMEKNGVLLDEIEEILNTDFLSKIISKRIKYLDAEDMIDKFIILALYVLELNTPAEAVIAVIDCFNHVSKTSKKLTVGELYTEVYPNGFYNTDTVSLIIDNVLKPCKCSNCDIY